jgi:shikimate kinase
MILKLKRTPGIYLIGFMGCGKTTIGRLLSDELGWKFIDLDNDIETQEKTSIQEIFDNRGEEEFRRIETEVLRKRVRSIQFGHPTVIALGGGAFTQHANFELLENNGVTIWLDCPFETALARVSVNDARPLARDPERFAQLYQDRREFYSKADYHLRISTDDPNEVVQQILALPPLFKP